MAPASVPVEYLAGYLGPFRLLLSDLLVLLWLPAHLLGTNTSPRSAPTSAATSMIRGNRYDFIPVPLEDVKGERVFFTTTAPSPVAERQIAHLEATHGCTVVGWSARLADRAGLAEDMGGAERFDVLLTELKAAAVDVACERALERGAKVVFVDNRAIVVEGPTDLDTALGDVIDLTLERGGHGPGDRAGERTERRGNAVTEKETEIPHIVISDREPGLPYSKGLMASQVMVTGLSPFRAYQVAEEIEEGSGAGFDLAHHGRALPDGPRGADRGRRRPLRQELPAVARGREARRSLVILNGGATGVGKSTIATQLAARLGIVRFVATDAVREVMRSMFSPELMPTLHTSSFEADAALREPPTRSADPLIISSTDELTAWQFSMDAVDDVRPRSKDNIIMEPRTWCQSSSTSIRSRPDPHTVPLRRIE